MIGSIYVQPINNMETKKETFEMEELLMPFR